MQSETIISIQEICMHHDIELSFIFSLKDAGLIEIVTVEDKTCIPADQLAHLEKMIRLYELDINLEGIETINYLLNRINDMQQEIIMLTNQLNKFENE
jgi:hypothetical protein